MVLRIEDTDVSRSTAASEQTLIADLNWLGITWDEGPVVGGPHGPYRQSERKELYMKYVDQLVSEGRAYPCFCTDEELAAQRAQAEAQKMAPIYRGPWADATLEQVAQAKSEGRPYCYRFRVPKNKVITINDLIRGEVSWNTDTLGDFVILRSNGLPVYNFCVAVDDATMGITHVIRAEEHLPNTLRQALIYDALGFRRPAFGHVSLILAPDRSKLSKRHGATAVGDYAGLGYLPAAMRNFLALLGWNDGTEREIFSTDDLAAAFSLERVTKSAAVFDVVKLNWMNGQYLRSLPSEELAQRVAIAGEAAGLLRRAQVSSFVMAATKLAQGSMDLVTDAVPSIRAWLEYPLQRTAETSPAQSVLEDDFAQVAHATLQAHASGALGAALATGPDGYKAWTKGVGKALGRKGKRLFMPLRLALTGSMQGPEVGAMLATLSLIQQDELGPGVECIDLNQRMTVLRAWLHARGECEL